ncbi:hypothetical protein E1211_23745 [Micromonospora sp. 15K316]|uniref:GerMN domain-containing protein n=1 Tax=Micromonospora sp. 15K316 TaxID=2530376 RepID=UPI00104E2C7D|nr:GerMN domain-containing protein [Micromonospora sp. 15K316]TDC30702.1 hypothetical protein E1211_23745 [Micromonospora sp. 15K316]
MTGGRRALLVALSVLALVAGCGVRPSAVITGGPAPVGPAHGTGLFFVTKRGLTLVLRPEVPSGSIDDALALLFAGPDPVEQLQGYRSEIPPDVRARTVTVTGAWGTTVRIKGDVGTLPDAAVDQIVCTARYAAPGGTPAAVTLAGLDGSRGPLTCGHPAVAALDR